MPLGKSIISEKEPLKFLNVEIQFEIIVKLLGVTMDHKLNFYEHTCINFQTGKAGAQLN